MLEVNGLTVRYGAFTAVGEASLSAADGQVVCVLGPSGCGKSTLLRTIAGLESPVSGRVVLAGEDITDWRPDHRRVGLMFQDHVLFPHRSVGENVAFGPRMRGASAPESRRRVDEVLDLVDLAGFAERPIAELSGGEQQRVALARAIAPRPRLLMLDEPLGSLDRALRDRLLAELPGVFAEIGTTVLYVTHDQEEALTLADRVAVMRAGQFVQTAAPETMWRAPASEFVAEFLGLGPVLDASVSGERVRTALGTFERAGLGDGPRRLVVLPGAATIASREGAAARAEPASLLVAAEVAARRFAGGYPLVRARTETGVELTVPDWGAPSPVVGQRIVLAIDTAGLHVL